MKKMENDPAEEKDQEPRATICEATYTLKVSTKSKNWGQKKEQKVRSLCMNNKRKEKLDSMLPEGWKVQVGAEDLLHPDIIDTKNDITI